jgi:hypothetical protein
MTVSMAGLSVRAVSTILRTSSVSGVAITSILARATCACTSTSGSLASPDTAGTPGGAQRGDDLPVLFRHHEGNAVRRQRLGQLAADAAVADQHHLPRQVFLSVVSGSSASGSSRASRSRATASAPAASAAAAAGP